MLKHLFKTSVKKIEISQYIMSTDRFIDKRIPAKLLPKDDNGLTCCRWCNTGVRPQEELFVHQNVYTNIELELVVDILEIVYTIEIKVFVAYAVLIQKNCKELLFSDKNIKKKNY